MQQYHKVSQMPCDKLQKGPCLHPFQSSQQIWEVFHCKYKPHVRSERVKQTFYEKAMKTDMRSTFGSIIIQFTLLLTPLWTMNTHQDVSIHSKHTDHIKPFCNLNPKVSICPVCISWKSLNYPFLLNGHYWNFQIGPHGVVYRWGVILDMRQNPAVLSRYHSLWPQSQIHLCS